MPHDFPDEAIWYLCEYIQGMKAELVFNFDEVDISE
jgi:hypothetical protein